MVNSKVEDGNLVIILDGRVDSGNAEKVEQEIDAAKAGHEDKPLVIDAEKLEYISSAGLRIMLRLRKGSQDMKIVKVNSEVYDVFDMTGFTDMITVEKA